MSSSVKVYLQDSMRVDNFQTIKCMPICKCNQTWQMPYIGLYIFGSEVKGEMRTVVKVYLHDYSGL